MDLIAIDIGNSTITVGVFLNGELQPARHLPVDQPDELMDIIKKLRASCGPQPLGAKTVPVVVSSVNAAGLQSVEEAVGTALDQRALLVGRDFPLEMKHAVEEIEKVGSDRLLTASAAYDVVQAAVVVADFGSATTIDCVNDMGIYLGGVIMPGLGMAARSLHAYTGGLPEVDVALPTGSYGTNTTTAIQNGIYYGAIGAFREVVEQYATQLGHWPQVVATGGYSRMIAQNCDFIDSLVADLCLSGLNLAWQKYRFHAEAEEGNAS